MVISFSPFLKILFVGGWNGPAGDSVNGGWNSAPQTGGWGSGSGGGDAGLLLIILGYWLFINSYKIIELLINSAKS